MIARYQDLIVEKDLRIDWNSPPVDRTISGLSNFTPTLHLDKILSKDTPAVLPTSYSELQFHTLHDYCRKRRIV